MIYRAAAIAAAILFCSQTARAQEPERWFASIHLDGHAQTVGPFTTLKECDAARQKEIAKVEDRRAAYRELEKKYEDEALAADMPPYLLRKAEAVKAVVNYGELLREQWESAICDRH